jgi:hypothetical protein
MWVEVMTVRRDPHNRSRHRVVLRNGALSLDVLWPGPAPHVGAVRVVELSCDTVAELGVTATEGGGEAVLDGSDAGLTVDAVLEERFEEGTGVFAFGDGGTLVLDLVPGAWQVGATYRVTLGEVSAFDTRIN